MRSVRQDRVRPEVWYAANFDQAGNPKDTTNRRSHEKGSAQKNE